MLARARSAAALGAMAARPALRMRGRGFFSGATAAGAAVHLPHRGVLRLRGRDSVSFLQGMCTQDVEAGLASGGPASRFATVLSPKGRVRFETVLWRASDDPGDVCVEVSASLLDRVARLIDRYQVRESFAVERPDDVHVMQLLPADLRQLAAPDRVMEAYTAAAQTSSASAEFTVTAALEQAWTSAGGNGASQLEVMAASPDPRCPVMGMRALVRGPAASLSASAPAAPTAYNAVRSLMGVPEGEAEAFEAVPLELNLEQLLGVSFVKGCYVGQELVARAHFRGLIRKRLLPVLLGQERLGAAVSSPPSEGDAGHRLAVGGGRSVVLPGIPGALFGGADGASEDSVAALEAAARVADAMQAAAAAATTAAAPQSHAAAASSSPPTAGSAQTQPPRLRIEGASKDSASPAGRSAGRLLSVVPGTNIGLAMMRLEGLRQAVSCAQQREGGAVSPAFRLALEGGESVAVTAVAPPYWQWVEGSHQAADERLRSTAERNSTA